jgi:cysteine-rich repeat protein
MSRLHLDPARLPLAVLGLLLPLACTPASDEGGQFSTFTTVSTSFGDGDGDPGETGDGDGDPGDGDGDPVPASCGDGSIDADEECDFGPANSDTGACTTACTVAGCGDGHIYAGVEDCDDGNDSNTDECVECVAAYCGDGFTQAGVETCDDGNDVEDDECTSSCVNSLCGDGIIQGNEQCDDNNVIDSDACPSTCQLAFCGDGFEQAGVEACDDGNLETNDACISPFCVDAFCGDGYVWDGLESCDDANMDDTDACPSCMVGFCGDGFTNLANEECDDANMDDSDFCNSDCTANAIYDDFETNNLNLVPWVTNGNGNWATNNTLPHQGSYSAGSGNIGNSQSTNLELTVNTSQGTVVRFWYKVSSEANYDYLRFYVNDVQQGASWSGNVPWAMAQFPVNAGLTVFRWTYNKDGSLVSGSDKAWIDEVYIGP